MAIGKKPFDASHKMNCRIEAGWLPRGKEVEWKGSGGCGKKYWRIGDGMGVWYNFAPKTFILL